jgi:sulfate adenylyltransferase
MNPEEIKSAFGKLGWRKAAAFYARNVIHRPHFELILKGMKETGANLLLLSSTGNGKPGDFDHYTRVRCYREIARHLPPASFILNLLHLSHRMAGPRETLLHAIVARNYGCTHFIVGHDHASPGCDGNGSRFYDCGEARKLAERYRDELGIDLVTFDEIVYLPFEDEFRQRNEVPDGTQTISLTGTDIRNRFRSGRKIPEWASFPEVIRELEKAYPPPRRQGIVIFFTGLSGAGKSTIAKILHSRLLEIGDRPISLLDGDIVRRNLSQELSFSKEHRDINVRRIGFVASEIAKNRGIAICAPIAPYAATRREIRQNIEKSGGFIEVYVSTPIEECERRDRKGMYAKARSGLIKGYTGVDDPYEIPENPEVRIDTSDLSPDQAAREILLFLGGRGYI